MVNIYKYLKIAYYLLFYLLYKGQNVFSPRIVAAQRGENHFVLKEPIINQANGKKNRQHNVDDLKITLLQFLPLLQIPLQLSCRLSQE